MKRTHWSQSPGPLLHVPHMRAFTIEIEIDVMFFIIERWLKFKFPITFIS